MRAAIAVALTFAIVVGVETASAAVFEVRACGSSSQAIFGLANLSPGTIETGSRCPSTASGVRSGIFAVARPDTLTLDGSTATWTITAPAGMSLRRLDLRRWFGTRREPWKIRVRTREGAILEACDLNGRIVCQLGSADGDTAATYSNLNTQSVSFAMECRTVPAASTCPGWVTPQAWLSIYSAVALVDDPLPPVIESLSGAALGPDWHDGVEQLNISASDLSGIRSISVSAGPRALFREDESCDYSKMQPCPVTKRTSIAVDTAKLPDGVHQLTVAVADAAAQSTVSTSTLRVDRTAPVSPNELTVERNPDGTLALRWTNPEQGTGAPIEAANYQVCDAAGANCGPSASVSGRDVQAVPSVVVPSGEHQMRVWLQDAAGNSDQANAASISVDASSITAPNVLDTRPPVLTDDPEPSARLRITRARRSGSTLTVSGTIARAASARIVARVSRSKSGRPVLAKARVKPKRGKWTARVRLPRRLSGARAMYLTVKYPGQNGYRATTLQRRLAERRARPGRATDEFSMEARGTAR